jgi:hypothetical protein
VSDSGWGNLGAQSYVMAGPLTLALSLEGEGIY